MLAETDDDRAQTIKARKGRKKDRLNLDSKTPQKSILDVRVCVCVCVCVCVYLISTTSFPITFSNSTLPC